MAIARYLAMTAREFYDAPSIPQEIAWMACHFSPYSTSLLNLPEKLPPNSLLILNDSTPPDQQDTEIIKKTLETTHKKHKCYGLLLDFQRPKRPEAMVIVQALINQDYPVCVSKDYAEDLDCPVFLPPLPLTVPLSKYLEPWSDREIWLDTALSCEEITVTEKGCTFRSAVSVSEYPFEDKELHCHYNIASNTGRFVFSLCRTKEDLDDLLLEAESLGITTAVGLYQELK